MDQTGTYTSVVDCIEQGVPADYAFAIGLPGVGVGMRRYDPGTPIMKESIQPWK